MAPETGAERDAPLPNASSPSPSGSLAIVGLIRRAHGIRGEVSVQLFTDSPDAVLASGGRIFVGETVGPEPPPASAHPLRIEASARLGDGRRILLEGISDRNAAERLRGRFLFVPMDEVPPPSPEEVCLHDLVGMRVVTTGGVELGTVEGWFELPQGVMLEVRREGKELLVPYQEHFVNAVDAIDRRIDVELPEGFLD